MKHIALKIYGKVQGVGFRYMTKKKAAELKLSGFVKNMPDGSVYLEASGQDDDLRKLKSWCKKGSKGAQAEEVRELKPNLQPKHQKDSSKFEIKY